MLPGILGGYPNTLLQVDKKDLPLFVEQLLLLSDVADYSRLLDAYGIRRTHPQFWTLSDELHEHVRSMDPTGFGFLDYSRLEAR